MQTSYISRGLATHPLDEGVQVCIMTHKLSVANKMGDFQNVIFVFFQLDVSRESVSHIQS